eukprot:scaffold45860_cov78-Phaeocystis_antarctica.AAC.7
MTVHIRRRAGRECMARPPRQRSVGASAPALANISAASGKPNASGKLPASVELMLSIAIPVSRTRLMAHTTRIARASVGKRARRRRKKPSGIGTSHQRTLPTAASIDRSAKYMIVGVAQITSSAHPACPMAKLTRSRRPAADARAARNTPLTAAKLAAPEKDRRVEPRSEGERGRPSWTPTLDSGVTAFPPRRSRRQPARPRSFRVGSRAMAMAAAKAIDCLQVVGKRDRGVATGAQAPGELKVNAAVALKITPLPGPGVEKRAVLLVAGVVVRLALVPVAIAGSVTRHAAAPTLGRAEPRLVVVEPEPQAIRRGELCRDEGIFLRRAEAGRYAPVLLAQVHTAEQRGGALGRHEEAGGAGGRGGPAGWADSRRRGREEEDGGDRQRANTQHTLGVG